MVLLALEVLGVLAVRLVYLNCPAVDGLELWVKLFAIFRFRYF